jgi:hypothetical protein
MIRDKKNGTFEVRSEDGRKLLGTYKHRKSAVRRLRQIELYKHLPPKS